MQSLWNDKEALAFLGHPLKERVYTSRLLGKSTNLVLHGGGNTSVKAQVQNLFGEQEKVLYVKGSGWDLATIEEAGFPAVKLDTLLRLAQLEQLSDTDMVRMQKSAMLDPSAPNPSVEAILHAIIPFTFVDHTHADAIVTLSNTPDGEARLRDLFGNRVLFVPYVMPGFVLAKKVRHLIRDIDWSNLEGMVLLHHGVFTFADDAKTSYERMINLVTCAEDYLEEHSASAKRTLNPGLPQVFDPIKLAEIRSRISTVRGKAMVATLDTTDSARAFSLLNNVDTISNRGPLTPDHVIRTKRIPAIIDHDIDQAITDFTQNYHHYFDKHNPGNLTCLDPAPRWAVWKNHGIISFGDTVNDATIVSDIKDHTIACIQTAEAMGGWRVPSQQDIFDVEYWELEQSKLNKQKSLPVFEGKVALVTGAASGIGKACALSLRQQGAAVIALDIAEQITHLSASHDAPDNNLLGIKCDVTNIDDINQALAMGVKQFGGIDILVSNAGIFPLSETIAEMDPGTWDKSLNVNLTSHQQMLKACIPFLQLGIDPAVVIIASKNVPAPGPGAAAYSVAKAGLTQLGRVAALELAGSKIRVNMLHPNAVFDTGIWTEETLAKRAGHYGLSVEEYKTRNLLQVEVTSNDVANLACALAGPLFAKATGLQIPIDGGNERVI